MAELSTCPRHGLIDSAFYECPLYFRGTIHAFEAPDFPQPIFHARHLGYKWFWRCFCWRIFISVCKWCWRCFCW